MQRTEPTTGRTNIAHLECSVVAKQVLAIYQDVIYRKKMRGSYENRREAASSGTATE
jgi:hypothetical protein